MTTKNKKPALFHPYKPRYGGQWYYLCRGKSKMCMKNAETDEVIASKDEKKIQAIADILNRVVRMEAENVTDQVVVCAINDELTQALQAVSRK